MLIDIGPNQGYKYYPHSLVTAGSFLFFVADVGGVESDNVLCSSDGSTHTTVLRDAEVNVGPVAWGDDVYFVAVEPQFETDDVLGLFRSDGTVAGTSMVVELGEAEDYKVTEMVLLGEQLVFIYDTPELTRRLWHTDGTSEGTEALAEPGSQAADTLPYGLIVADDRLFFAGSHTDIGLEIFTSDGTASGTKLVMDVMPGSDSSFSYTDWVTYHGVAENTLYVRANDGEHGNELWLSDGTEVGTYMVADINPDTGYSNPSQMTWFDDRLFFSADDEGSYGRELWVTDGTEVGTELVKDIYPGGSYDSYPSDFAVHDGQLYFAARGSYDDEDIWVTDGTEDGTVIAIDIDWGDDPVYFRGIFSVDDLLAFDIRDYPDTERYVTDMSSTSSPIELIYTNPDDAYVGMGPPLVFDGSIWFDTGRLWRSDGTAESTEEATRPLLVRNNYDDGEDPAQFTLFDSKLWFVAEHEEYGLEIWHTDGTPESTAVLGNLTGGFGPGDLTAGDNELFFSQYDGSGYQQATLWQSDGTVGGSSQISEVVPDSSYSYPNYFTAVGSLLYFTYHVYTHGNHLWVTDGTAQNTRQVIDLYADHGDDVAIRGQLGDLVLFTADDGGGKGLWVTDGTAQNTEELGSGIVSVTSLVEVDEVLLFGADDGSGTELWLTDGTTGGTYEVVEIRAGDEDGVTSFGPIPGRSSSATTYFFVGDDGENGRELWVTDGTANGTEMVADIRTGAEGSSPRSLAEMGGYIYFVANDGVHGSELWRSNGTEVGTEMVADVYPGPASGCRGWQNSWLSSIFPVSESGLVMFPARNEESNVDLWISDGTEANTLLYWDLAHGIQGSYPHSFSRIGDNVVFLADDSARGEELWTVPIAALADPWPPEITCPADKIEEAAGPSGAAVTFVVTATDDTTADPEIEVSHASASTFPLGTTVVTATATDDVGNQAQCVFTIDVADTTAPDLDCPDTVTEEATKPEGADVMLDVTATDLVTVNPTVVVTPASGTTFALGSADVTVTATDDAGNEATCDFDVLVEDTTPPALTCPNNIVVEAGEGATEWPVTFDAALVRDLVTDDPVVTATHTSGSNFPLGTTTVTITAEDAAGNEESCLFDITVNEYGTVVAPPGDDGEDAGGGVGDAGYNDTGGGATGDGPGEGCGCSANGGGGTSSLFGLLLVFALVIRRRRA